MVLLGYMPNHGYLTGSQPVDSGSGVHKDCLMQADKTGFAPGTEHKVSERSVLGSEGIVKGLCWRVAVQ